MSIQDPDRRKHMAIFGKSGVDKTTLMGNMTVADLPAGNGITVIDPHGSLIENLFACIILLRKIVPASRQRSTDSKLENAGMPMSK